MIEASEKGLHQTSVALAFQMRAVPKACLIDHIRDLTENELGELELAPMKRWDAWSRKR